MHRYNSKMNLTLLIVLLLICFSCRTSDYESAQNRYLHLDSESLKFWAILLSILTVLEKNGQIVGM